MPTPIKVVGRLMPASQSDTELQPRPISKKDAMTTSQTCQALMTHYHADSPEWQALALVAHIASEHVRAQERTFWLL